MVVFPPCSFREAHEYALNPASSFEPEDGTSVVDEVELDVAPTANLLPSLFGLGEAVVLVLIYDGTIGFYDGVHGLLRKFEQ